MSINALIGVAAALSVASVAITERGRPDVPDRWFPQDSLGPKASRSGCYSDRPTTRCPEKIGADAWFDRAEAPRYEVQEQTSRTGDDEILTLILIRDASRRPSSRRRWESDPIIPRQMLVGHDTSDQIGRR